MERRDSNQHSSDEAARELLNTEISELSDKIELLSKTRDSLEIKFNQMICNADPTKPNDLSVCVSEAQAIKRKADEQTCDIDNRLEPLIS